MPVLSGDSVKMSVKGGLLKFVEFWQTISVPDFILSIIWENYKILFVSIPLSMHFAFQGITHFCLFCGNLILVLPDISKFTVLPFGLSSAPFIFTKSLRLLETLWRSLGVPIAFLLLFL